MSLEFAKLAKKNKWTDKHINDNRNTLFKSVNNEPSMTKQEFAKECDVNRIVNKFVRTGQIPYQDGRIGIYSDVSSLPDYKSSLEFIISAQETFEQLDANVKKRFQNDPQKLIDFLADPNNRKEAQKLGLVPPDPPGETPPDPPGETPPAPPEPEPEPTN